jgi:hypothetical protein
MPTVVFAFHLRSVGRYDRCFLASGWRTSIFIGSGQLSARARGIGILRSTTIEALICGQASSPHLHSPLVTGLVAMQDGSMVDSG